MTPFDFSVRDGVRTDGSRGGGAGPRPARILEIRYDPSPEVERRVLDAIKQLLDACWPVTGGKAE